MTLTLNENGLCCDPLGIGCKHPTVGGFSLPNSPHRRAPQPCQKCRARQIIARRKAEGRPLRTGKQLKEAL